jgi:mono/diheme cytochrome c family protein
MALLSLGQGRRSLLVLSARAVAAAAVFYAPAAGAQDGNGGREVFLSKCARCHGRDGVPKRIAKEAPNLSDPTWSLPIDQIEHSIREGKGKDMKPFKFKLKPEQIQAVAAYVQTLNKVTGDPPATARHGEPR